MNDERQDLPSFADFGAVRRARVADAARIVEMVGALAAHHGDASTLTADDLTRDAFGRRPWIHVLVADTGAALAGYAVLYGLVQLQFGARGMEMHHLFTEAGFRGRGVGCSLVDACKIEAISHACRYLAVSTDPDNRDAQAFYEARGFERRRANHSRFVIRLNP